MGICQCIECIEREEGSPALSPVFSEAGGRNSLQPLNTYEILRTLGSGPTGAVKLCRPPTGHDPVAVKFIAVPPSTALHRANVAVLLQLRHAHVVHWSEITQDQQNVILMMEFFPDGPIMELDDAGRAKTPALVEPQAARYLRQALHGLEYLHGSNIVHGAIKPTNLLLDRRRDRIRLADGGMAMLFAEPNLLPDAALPYFAAPETTQGEPPSARSDVWQLGITWFVLVVGHVPFLGAAREEVVRAVQSEPLHTPNVVSLVLGALLRDLLHKRPERRLTLADTKVHPWLQAGGESVGSLAIPNPADTVTPPTTPLDPGSPMLSLPPDYWILIVQEDVLQRVATRRALDDVVKPGAVGVHEVGDGAAALRACETRLYQLILVETDLAVLHGFDLVPRLRSLQRSGADCQSLHGTEVLSRIIGLVTDPSHVSSDVDEVFRLPATPTAWRQLCLRCGVPLADDAAARGGRQGAAMSAYRAILEQKRPSQVRT